MKIRKMARESLEYVIILSAIVARLSGKTFVNNAVNNTMNQSGAMNNSVNKLANLN